MRLLPVSSVSGVWPGLLFLDVGRNDRVSKRGGGTGLGIYQCPKVPSADVKLRWAMS